MRIFISSLSLLNSFNNEREEKNFSFPSGLEKFFSSCSGLEKFFSSRSGLEKFFSSCSLLSYLIRSRRKITFPFPRDWKSFFPPAHLFPFLGRSTLSLSPLSVFLSFSFSFQKSKFKPAGHKITYVPLGWLPVGDNEFGLGFFLFLLFVSNFSTFSTFSTYFSTLAMLGPKNMSKMSRMSKKSRQTLGKGKIPLQSHCRPLVTNLSVHK